MFRISAITRVGLVAVACVAVAAPSALAKAPAKGNAKSLYGYAMSYAPTKLTPEPAKPAKVQSWLYGYAMFYAPTKLTPEPAKPAKVQSWVHGYAMFYAPTKATRKAAKPAKVQSLYGYAMSYTPTKATRKAAKPAKVQSLYGYAMSYTPTKATREAAKPVTQTAATSDDPYLTDVYVRPGESLGGPDGGPAVPRPALESKDTSAKADTQADIERMRRIWTDRD